jgi:glycine cleavage system aminomethyltransferase T/glycine/D-amino acid oxidase-like deaminating enzyme
MHEMPNQAKVVIIGAGIVGNSVAYHLAEQSWKDLVLIEKGPLPNPGGSTGHASNFVFPMEDSKVMFQITQDSMRQFKELGVFRTSGGVELARSQANFIELRRRIGLAKTWGVEGELLTPSAVAKLLPFVNTKIILGGFSTPATGVVDPLRTGTIMREKAQQRGALSVFANTEVLGLVTKGGRIFSVKTSRGEIRAEHVVIACGVWSPRIARMAGASIPLTPIVHQMISVGPITAFAKSGGEIDYPIIRDMTALMYERQNGSDMEIGSFAHRAIPWEPDDIPALGQSKLSPTELPFTREDFEPQMADALELLPDLLEDKNAGIQHAINGLLSQTPDAGQVLGETPEVKGLWSAAAVWIKHGPGVGRLIAEWMTAGSPELDVHEIDIARFYPYARTTGYVRSRASEGYVETYTIAHPREQWQSCRGVRLSPFYAREKELGAVFFETAGWERPNWYESNRNLLEKYKDRVADRSNEWDARWWSPIINAEHLALREHAGIIDLSAFAIFDVIGVGALDYIQRLTVAQMDVAPGRAVYTPLLDRNGGIKSDLTITRLSETSFRIVTGGSQGGIDGKWFRDNLPSDGSVDLQDMTSSLCTVGLWGPRARSILQSVTDDDVSNAAFPFSSAKAIEIGPISVWALRISYVGELGWELYAPMEQGQLLWDLLWEAGKGYGLVPVGIGVYATTARLEKAYRLYGNELDTEYGPHEAGLARPKVKPQDFIGKQAYVEALRAGPAAILCTLTVDDHTSSTGELRYMLGKEPVLTPSGASIIDRKNRRSYITSAGSGPSVEKYILMSYLPPEYAKVGTKLKVEYFGDLYPVTVAIAGSVPLYDPTNERTKQ